MLRCYGVRGGRRPRLARPTDVMRSGTRSSARRAQGYRTNKQVLRKTAPTRRPSSSSSIAERGEANRRGGASSSSCPVQVAPGDVTLLLNDPLHACSGCAKQGRDRVLALYFYRLAPPHRGDILEAAPGVAHLPGELSNRESRGMARSFRRGFSFEQSREMFSGTDWRNITNYFVAERQRKRINSSMVRLGAQLLRRVSPAVNRTVREMTSEQLGLSDFVLVEAFCNYYVSASGTATVCLSQTDDRCTLACNAQNDLSTQRGIELHADNTDLSVVVQLDGDGVLHVHGTQHESD
eukprot:COSAG01_NODE_3164_length_6477_cov_6.494983_3_plen_294_part_00